MLQIPSMEFNLTLHRGNEVLTLIDDPGFVACWNALAESDGKFTLIQERPFVSVWYRQHMPRFEPLLCVGRDASDQLVGLMPLAHRRDTNALTHAGDFHAEYHGWIAVPELDERFAEECLIALRSLGVKRWDWNWLPPGSPIGFLKSKRLSEHGIFSTYETQQSPIWNLDDNERLEKLLRTKSIKIKNNRYTKRGAFYLERVRDKQRTQQLLEVCRQQNDFRQEAIHGVRPFADNPLKAPFFVERQNFPEANHFTVQWSKGRPLSFHFGACDKDTLVLGLTAYDPTEGRNSPGTLHLIALARLLKEEGLRRFDLTPGADQYKEFFANAWQTLVKPSFYFSRAGRLRADVRLASRRYAKRALGAVDITPERFRKALTDVNTLAARAKTITLPKLLRIAKQVVREEFVYLQYRMELEHSNGTAPRDLEVHVQRYEDLLLYRDFNLGLSRAELLRTALKRFSDGETLYTSTCDGVLVQYGWVMPAGRTYFLEGVEVTITTPPDCALLYDFFTHPAYRRQGLRLRTMRQMLRNLAETGVAAALAGVQQDNEAFRRSIEEVGFRIFRTFKRKRVLWRQIKSENMAQTGMGDPELNKRAEACKAQRL